jgi:hypothetical protein
MRFPALAALILLAACSPKLEAVEAEPVVVEEVPAAGPGEGRCTPGEDDGIGGTGCKVD